MTHETTGHSRCSPSGAYRWMNCPGSIHYCELLPEDLKNTSSIFADEGTAAHFLVEQCLQEDKDPEDFKGELIRVFRDENGKSDVYFTGVRRSKGVFEVDDNMIEAVRLMVDYVWSEYDRLGEGVEMFIEERVYPLEDEDGNPEPNTSGLADVVLSLWPDEIVIIDYKHGAGVAVDVEDNPQMLTYGAGVARKNGFTHEKIKIAIVQPRCPHEDGAIRTVEMQMEDLVDWRDEVLRPALEVVLESDETDLSAGEWCLFCPALPVCAEFKAEVQGTARMDFSEDPDKIEIEPSKEELERILAWIPLIDKWSKETMNYAKILLQRGQELDGFKLVEKTRHRQIRDNLKERQIVKWFRKRGVPKSKMYTEPQLKSVAQLQKLLPKKFHDKFNEVIIYKPKGEVVIAPDKDPRRPVKSGAAVDFENEYDEAWD